MHSGTRAVGQEPFLAECSATLQHIAHLRAKRERLLQLQHEAEEQVFHRIGVAYETGRIDMVELAQLWDACRQAVDTGYTRRWKKAVPVGVSTLLHALNNPERYRPEPDGVWRGENPRIDDRCTPLAGTAVVYVLYDDRNEPCYVGSTGNLRSRLRQHAAEGKQYERWMAYACRDREHAYEKEIEMQSQFLPYLNRRKGR